MIEGNALVVPLKLRDPQGAFSFDNVEVEGRKAIPGDKNFTFIVFDTSGYVAKD